MEIKFVPPATGIKDAMILGSLVLGCNPFLDHLPELGPPRELVRGLEAVRYVRQALEVGTLKSREWDDVNVWVKKIPENKAAFDAAVGFLRGKKLEEAEDLFEETYAKQVHDRAAWAALAAVRAQTRNGPVTLVVEEPDLCGPILERSLHILTYSTEHPIK